MGTLLLDPHNITITTGADSGHDGGFTAIGDDSVINATTLLRRLLGRRILAMRLTRG
ncbi:hypothetical protein [Bradyrhizobium sp.]|uniref:hypothetical protein n=1 Tax=Bradyrhizobium sp. TaxID=376 RepID=UPI0039E5825B